MARLGGAVITLTHFYELIGYQIGNLKKFETGREVMGPTKPVNFDLDTVALMRETLDEAWARLRPQERAVTPKSSLAVRILETAAQGERDPQRRPQ